MAYSFVKRPGAPAGTINISVAAGSFVIDDAANSIITTSSQQAASDLVLSPYLVLQGTPSPAPYVAARGTNPEIAYAEITSNVVFTAMAGNTNVNITGLDQLVATTGTRPYVIECFLPIITNSGAIAQQTQVYLWEDGVRVGRGDTFNAGTNLGGTVVARCRRPANPGSHTWVATIRSTGATARDVTVFADPQFPAFLQVSER